MDTEGCCLHASAVAEGVCLHTWKQVAIKTAMRLQNRQPLWLECKKSQGQPQHQQALLGMSAIFRMLRMVRMRKNPFSLHTYTDKFQVVLLTSLYNSLSDELVPNTISDDDEIIRLRACTKKQRQCCVGMDRSHSRAIVVVCLNPIINFWLLILDLVALLTILAFAGAPQHVF